MAVVNYNYLFILYDKYANILWSSNEKKQVLTTS